MTAVQAALSHSYKHTGSASSVVTHPSDPEGAAAANAAVAARRSSRSVARMMAGACFRAMMIGRLDACNTDQWDVGCV